MYLKNSLTNILTQKNISFIVELLIYSMRILNNLLTNTHSRTNPKWNVSIGHFAIISESFWVKHFWSFKKSRVLVHSVQRNIDCSSFFDYGVSIGDL